MLTPTAQSREDCTGYDKYEKYFMQLTTRVTIIDHLRRCKLQEITGFYGTSNKIRR
ncbi:MAG: hypothetical protein ABGX16_04595 [Pirellulales bacterium]